MLRGFKHVGNRYELTFQHRPGAVPVRLRPSAAKRLLSAWMSQMARVRELRSLLATRSGGLVSRMTDAEVADHLMTRIAARQLHVYAEPVRARSYEVEETADEAPLAPLSVKDVDEPVDDGVDVPAQVAVMQMAARNGVPFCEECEKKRLAREAAAAAPAAAPDPYANTDIAAQVAVMKAAAVTGVPFCEECEKKRLAREAAAAAAAGPVTAPVAAPPPNPYAETDVVAQSAVMRSAAEDGVPFCEECEKARLAAAAAGQGGG